MSQNCSPSSAPNPQGDRTGAGEPHHEPPQEIHAERRHRESEWTRLPSPGSTRLPSCSRSESAFIGIRESSGNEVLRTADPGNNSGRSFAASIVTPRGTYILHPQQVVSIEGAHGVVFDVDDTLIQGSGETIHDGAGGRFRGGINLALRALGRPEITPEVWEAQHRGISGSNETDVIRLHALLAGIEPEELTQCQELWWRANLPSIINQTTLLDGLPELLEDLSARKIARAVCSASSLDIVKAMLKLKGVWDHIEYGLGWAGKRVGPGRYCGIPYEQTCRIIGLSPSDVVMVGDSIADMATQRLGIARSSSPRPHGHGPISVLISPNHEQLHGKMLEIEAFHRTHPESVTEHGIIFVAHSARQLRFGAKEGPLRWLVGPSDSPALRPESLP